MNTHRPALIISIILSLGILAGKFVLLPFWIWVAGLFALTVLSCIVQRALPVYMGIVMLGAVLIMNTGRFSSDSAAMIPYDIRQAIQMTEGVIDSNPQHSIWAQGRQTIFILNVRQIETEDGWAKQRGKIQVHVYSDQPFHYGQLVQLSGHWYGIYDGGDEKFSYRKYMQDQGVFWAVSVGKKGSIKVLAENKGHWLVARSLQIQQKVQDVFERYLDHDEAGMIIAMVLGERTAMPKELQASFINTGTAHIIAISGMNMTIITTILFFILKLCRLPKAIQYSGTIFFLFTYGFLTGLSASVVRACIMSSLVLMSFAFELESEALNSLGLAALILLLINPSNLFDIGFQLSFAAVLAILTLYKHCLKLFSWLPKFFATTLAVSLAAWIGTAPFIFYHFKMITPISVLANIPIVPLADLTVALGLGLGITGLFCDPLANAFAGCLKLVFNFMVLLADCFNQIPFGHFNFN